jgi:hypothetical protein
MKYKVYTKAAVQHAIADPISSPIGFCPWVNAVDVIKHCLQETQDRVP